MRRDEQLSKTTNYLIFGFAAIFFFLSASFRSWFSATHFTHYDDLYGAYLMRIVWAYDVNKLNEQLVNYGSPTDLSWVLNDISIGWLIEMVIKMIMAPIAVAYSSTFAPFQYLLISPLMGFDFPYSVSLILVRMPALLAAIAFQILLLNFGRYLYEKKEFVLLIPFLILPGISWMLYIYSAQGTNHSIALLFLVGWLIFLKNFSKASGANEKFLPIIVVLLAGTLSSYQLIFFLPAFVAAYICIFASKQDEFDVRLFAVLKVSLAALLAFLVPYFLFIKRRIREYGEIGISYNSGLQGEFVFSFDPQLGFFSNTIEFFRFLFTRSHEVLFSILGPVQFHGSAGLLFTSMYLVFSFLGLFWILRRRDIRWVAVFILVGFLTWLYLIAVGKMAFSPTRHSLVYALFFWILASCGLNAAITFIFSTSVKRNLAGLVLAFALSAFFIVDYEKIIESRKNPYLANDMFSRISASQPDIIIAPAYTMDLHFDNIIMSSYNQIWQNSPPFYTVFSNKNQASHKKNNPRIMIVCSTLKECLLESTFEFFTNGEYKQNLDFLPTFSLQFETGESVDFGNRAPNGENYLRVLEYTAISNDRRTPFH